MREWKVGDSVEIRDPESGTWRTGVVLSDKSPWGVMHGQYRVAGDVHAAWVKPEDLADPDDPLEWTSAPELCPVGEVAEVDLLTWGVRLSIEGPYADRLTVDIDTEQLDGLLAALQRMRGRLR